MTKARLLVLSLGGTITMVPDDSGGIAPKLGAAELVASVPALAEVAEIDARSPFRLPSPSLTPGNLVEVARMIEEGFASGFDGAVVIQGTDTIEESAFILDLLVGGEKPVVITGAMRGADAPGADGPANLLAAARVAAAPEAHGLGTLAVLNYDIHAARFVQKSHTVLPSAFLSPLGVVAEGRPRFFVRVSRAPSLPASDGPPAPVALVKWGMGDDGRMLKRLARSRLCRPCRGRDGRGPCARGCRARSRRSCREDPGCAGDAGYDRSSLHAHLWLCRVRDRPDRPQSGARGLPVRPQSTPAAGLQPAVGKGGRHGRRSFRTLSIRIAPPVSAIRLDLTRLSAAAVLDVRPHPRKIARCAFMVALLAVVIRNVWETFMVILGLIVIGLGQGALATLLFTSLAAASPKELAGDVGSLRGTANNLAGGVGTAIAGALLVGLLSASVKHDLADNPIIPPELKTQVDLDNVTFVNNDRLLAVLQRTTATPQQVDEAVRINTEARLLSLRICLFALTGLALLAIFPAGGLPGYVGDDVPNSQERGDREGAGE